MVSRYGINEGLGYIEKLRAKPKRCTALNKLTLSRSNEDVQRVLVKQGEHVGNLKLFSGYESSRLSVTTRMMTSFPAGAHSLTGTTPPS